jgi:hypothetical protein
MLFIERKHVESTYHITIWFLEENAIGVATATHSPQE